MEPISKETDEALRRFMDKTPAMAVLKVGAKENRMSRDLPGRERGEAKQSGAGGGPGTVACLLVNQV